MFLLKDTTQWRRWGSNPRPFGLESSTLPLSHWAPWTSSHYLCENDLEEVQGATTSSHIPQPLTRTMAMCTALACRAPCSISVKLGHWKDRPAAQWQGHDQTDLQYQAVRCGHSKGKLAELDDLDLILRERRHRWFEYVEYSAAVRTACDIKGGGRQGLGDPSWHGRTDGKRLQWVEAYNSWPSRKEHLEIRCDLLCMQLASNLEGGPLM